MTYNEVIQAIDSGKKVCWSHIGYKVIKDSVGQYLIHCTMNDTYVGLKSEFWFYQLCDFVLTFDHSDFFIVEE